MNIKQRRNVRPLISSVALRRKVVNSLLENFEIVNLNELNNVG